MVFLIPDSGVAIARHLVVAFGDWSRNLVGMEISTSLSMDEANDTPIRHKAEWCFGIEFRLTSVRIEEPIVVGVFVMVAGDLLLAAALWVCLDM